MNHTPLRLGFVLPVVVAALAASPAARAQSAPEAVPPAPAAPPASAPTVPTTPTTFPDGTPVQLIRMRDGTISTGRILRWHDDGGADIELLTGESYAIAGMTIVDVRLATDQLNLGTLPAGVASPTQETGFLQVRVATLEPGPERVPIEIRSRGRALDVGTYVGTTHRPYLISNTTMLTHHYAPLCETPCTLYALPGPSYLWIGSAYNLPPTVRGVRLDVVPASGAMEASGAVLLPLGAIAIIAGGIASLIGATQSSYSPDARPLLETGVGAMIGGGVAAVAGTVLLILGRRHISVQPLVANPAHP